MNRILRTILTMALALMMVAGLVGCGDGTPAAPAGTAAAGATQAATTTKAPATAQPTEAAKASEDVYPIEGNHKLTYWVEIGAVPLETIKDNSENLSYIVKREATGVDVEFIHPPVGQARENFNLLLASDDLPDIMERVNDFYMGGIDASISDGYFVRMNELIEEYSPNWYAIVNSSEEIRKEAFTDTGNIMGYGMVISEEDGMNIAVGRETPWIGPQVNKAWLDEAGLEPPTTIEGWDEMLRAFKENHPDGVPFLFWGNSNKNGVLEDSGAIISAYGLGPKFFHVNNEVMYGPYTDSFKDYLKTMASWYADGLLAEDFPSMDDTVARTLYLNGQAGVMIQGTGTTLTLSNQGDEWIGLHNPKLEGGDDIHWTYKNNMIRGYWTLITADCEIPEIAAKWMDWNYTLDGYIAMNFGRDGESFNGIDAVTGRPNYADYITANNYADFDRFNSVFRLHNGPYLRTDKRAVPRRSMEFLEDGVRKPWREEDNSYVLPPITLTAEEGSEYATLFADIETYKNTMTLDFIMGKRDIDAEFDTYMAQMKSLNMDRVLQLQQAALDRYNQR
jgi:putative aldouronate transport system substrate-binding protein